MGDRPLGRQETRKLLDHIRRHESQFEAFAVRRRNTISELLLLADDLDGSKKKVRISKIFGSVGGIVSAGLTIAGLATIFIPPVGIPLVVAGTAVGVASGITGAGATFGELFKKNETTTKVNKVLKADNQALLDYQEGEEGLQLTIRVMQSIRGITPFGAIVTSGIQIARLVDMLADASGVALRTAGAAVDAIPIVGAVINLITLPVDIATLISNSVDIHKATPHQLSTRLRELAQQLEEGQKDLRLRHDEVSEELEDMLIAGVAPRPLPLSATEVAFYVIVVVLLALCNLYMFMFHSSNDPLLVGYDVPMLPYD